MGTHCVSPSDVRQWVFLRSFQPTWPHGPHYWTKDIEGKGVYHWMTKSQTSTKDMDESWWKYTAFFNHNDKNQAPNCHHKQSTCMYNESLWGGIVPPEVIVPQRGTKRTTFIPHIWAHSVPSPLISQWNIDKTNKCVHFATDITDTNTTVTAFEISITGNVSADKKTFIKQISSLRFSHLITSGVFFLCEAYPDNWMQLCTKDEVSFILSNLSIDIVVLPDEEKSETLE